MRWTLVARAAESLGLGAEIGVMAAGYEADLIALEGNPLEDPTALGRVVFVMKSGREQGDHGHLRPHKRRRDRHDLDAREQRP